MEVDVLIVGAGPAGSTTARYCAGKDVDVLLIDRRREIGYPVQCGEFMPCVGEMYSMFPESMDLEELMNVDESLKTCHSEFVDLVSPGGRIYRCGFRGETLDRRRFDKYLANLALEAGADLRTGVTFKALRDGIAQTSMGDIKAKVVVGADGPTSKVARDAGLPNPSARFPAITCQAEGSYEPVVKMFFGGIAPGGYAWVIPKSRGANVGIGVNPAVYRGHPSDVFNSFVSKLGCGYSQVAMKFVPMGGPVRTTVKGNVLLVGDAAGLVMPTNGGGLPLAMIAGRIAGQVVREHVLAGSSLSEYERRWRAVLSKPLKHALDTRRLADVAFLHDGFLGLAMAILGRRGLSRAIRCRSVFH